MANELIKATKIDNTDGIFIGWQIIYTIDGVRQRLILPAADIVDLNNQQIRSLAQMRADADTTIIGSDPGEAIIPNEYKAIAKQARNEIDFLETTIPNIDSMTAVQVRDVVKRLAQENLRMLKAILQLGK